MNLLKYTYAENILPATIKLSGWFLALTIYHMKTTFIITRAISNREGTASTLALNNTYHKSNLMYENNVVFRKSALQATKLQLLGKLCWKTACEGAERLRLLSHGHMPN